jgi:hypothetical protein
MEKLWVSPMMPSCRESELIHSSALYVGIDPFFNCYRISCCCALGSPTKQISWILIVRSLLTSVLDFVNPCISVDALFVFDKARLRVLQSHLLLKLLWANIG